MRVALVHDWLTGMRGGEKVLDVLCELYPGAELFTLVYVEGSVSPVIAALRRHTSFIQRLPGAARMYRQYLPLFPMAIEQFDLDPFDLVISTSHCAAKSVVVAGRARHICYCHTPMRYAWDQFESYFGRDRIGPTANRLLRPTIAWLARWDAATAPRVHRYLANSQHVARRICRYYNRSAHVVYPPVDTRFFHPDGAEPGAHFLIVSALVPYKRIDLAIQACRARGEWLRIVGQGPERERLRQMADSSVEFLGSLTDEQLRQEYRTARAVILPGEEDFGIAPIEAQACGRPVVALARGGALETVVDGVTGVLVPEATVASLAQGLRRVRELPFDTARIRRHAERFSRERFAREIAQEIGEFANHAQ